jgi:hypothetical protein
MPQFDPSSGESRSRGISIPGNPIRNSIRDFDPNNRDPRNFDARVQNLCVYRPRACIMTLPRPVAGAASEEPMSAFAIRIALIAMTLGAPITVALADSPPKLNVGPSCEAAARGAIVMGRDKAACMGDENAALDVLKKNWAQYNGADKVQCLGNVRQGGPASYVELLSCLEIMRDAKTIRETDPADQESASISRRRGRR